MEALKKIARQLLSDGRASLVIGYGENRRGQVRALFIHKPEDASRLIFDERCLQNLSVYLHKPEVKRLGKPALVAHDAALRTLLQLAAEKQLEESDLVVISVATGLEPVVFETWAQIEKHLAGSIDYLPASDREIIGKLESLSLEERWRYWQERLSRCFKCYACRAACPLCYCPSCTAEINQPQWISVPSHDLGNLEWHVMRAMHLAGRCIGCGECGRACPLGIPVHLLSFRLSEELFRGLGSRAGLSASAEHALSTFSPGDKDDFIR